MCACTTVKWAQVAPAAMALAGMAWPWATMLSETPSTSSKGSIMARSPTWHSWKASKCLTGRGRSSAKPQHVECDHDAPQLPELRAWRLVRLWWSGTSNHVKLRTYLTRTRTQSRYTSKNFPAGLKAVWELYTLSKGRATAEILTAVAKCSES